MTGPCGCDGCDCGHTIEKLQAFKDWVHTYLDSKGVPYHPPGTHGAEGCRIGDRMDWLMAEMETLRRQNAGLVDVLEAFVFAAKIDLHLHLTSAAWKDLIAHAEKVIANAKETQ